MIVTSVLGKVREESAWPIGEDGSAELAQVRFLLSLNMGGEIPMGLVDKGELAIAAADKSYLVIRSTRSCSTWQRRHRQG